MKKLLLSIGIGTFSMFGFAQMSGTYTLDPGQAASSTNFTSWDAVFDELTTSGVDADVTINVAEGTITEYVYRSFEEISGASDTARILIQSDPNNSTMPVLQYSGSTTMYFYYCDFDYLTIDGINIKNTYSWGGRTVYVYRGSSEFMTFSNNVFDIANYNTSSYTIAGVYVYYHTAEQFTIEDNEFNNGGSGIAMRYNYNNNNADTTFKIVGNNINTARAYGIYHQYWDSRIFIMDNDIEVANGSSTAYGIYSYYAGPGSRISGNHIEVTTSYSSSWGDSGYGMYVYYMGRDYYSSAPNGDAMIDGNVVNINNNTGQRFRGIHNYYMWGTNTSRTKVQNNMVSTANGFQQHYGIYNYLSNYTDVINNSVNIGSTNSSSYGIYHYTYTSAYSYGSVYNNIIKTANTSPYHMYVYDPGSFAGGGNNLFYAGNTTSMKVYWRTAPFNYFGTSYDLASFESNTGIGGCMILDPNFVSNTDLHLNLSNISAIEPIDGAGWNVGLDYDIDGQDRLVSLPDIGADEFGVANNASPGTPLSPQIPACDGNVCLTTTVINTGTSPLTSVNVHWSLNGVAQTTVNWTGNLGQGGSDTLDLDCNTTWTDGDEIRIYTALPNGVLDSLAANDTIDMEIFFGLAGTYSIPGNYATLADAVDDLNVRGVCEATVMELAPGTYSGDSIDLRNILGTSDTNTVTWRSSTGDANDVTIEYAGTSTVNYVVNLSGTNWQIFEDLTFENTQVSNFGYGTVVAIGGGSSNNTFDNCVMNTFATTSTSTNMANVYINGGSNKENVFSNNVLQNGSYGFRMEGGGQGDDENTVIMNNEINDMYYYGIRNYYTDGVQIVGNRIMNDEGNGYQFSYGIYNYYADGVNVDQNYVANKGGQYGMAYPLYVYYCDGTGANPVRITNNCVTAGLIGQTIYGYYGMIWGYGNYAEIYGNSFNRLGGYTTSTNYAPLYIPGGNALKIKNNAFSNYSGTANAAVINQPFGIVESDNNNYFTTDTNNLVYFGGNYATLAEMQAVTGMDMNSLAINPEYSDTTMCATCEPTLNNLGTPVSANMDVNGATRSSETPDIGAVEYYPLAGFELGEDSTLCASDWAINLSPTANVVWSVNGTVVNDPIAWLNTNGETEEFEVFVNINSEACGLFTDDATYTLVPNAELDSAIHLCADESVLVNPGGSVTDSYVWSTGATTQALEITSDGIYTVTKMGNGCTSTATTVVTQSAGVDIADAEGCAVDGAITLDATVFNGTSYAWSAGSSLNTAQNTFNDAGSYAVSATDIYGCTSSDSFNVFLLEEPVAIIDEDHSGNIYIFDGTNSNDVTSNSTYSWDFGNGTFSTNGVETVHYPWSQPVVSYTVTLTVDNGCGTDSKQMEITPDPLGVDAIDAGSFALYPNPTSGLVNFKLANTANSEGTIQVMDISGRVVLNNVVKAGQANGEINVTDLAAGSYMVKVSVDGTSSINTLIKQ